MDFDNLCWFFVSPTAAFSAATFVAYFAYRIFCLVAAQQDIKPADALGLAWFFLVVEFLIFGMRCRGQAGLFAMLMAWSRSSNSDALPSALPRRA